MPRVMGVNCDSGKISMAVVEDGTVLDGLPERIPVPAGLEEHDRLWAVYDDLIRVIQSIKPDRIGILCPEGQYTASHRIFTPRIALETMVRMAGSAEKVPVEILQRPTVRSRLEIARKGSLDSHLAHVVPEPVGRYWSSGRGLAAMVALAGERD